MHSTRHVGFIACAAGLGALILPTTNVRADVGFDLGDIPPSFSAFDQNGNLRSLSEFSGEYLFLDFCAVWCAPCNFMASEVMDTYNAWAGHPTVQFEYLTVLLQGPTFQPSTQTDAMNWATAHSITRPILHTNGTVGTPLAQFFTDSGFNGIPAGMLLDPSMTIIDKTAGYQTPQQIFNKVKLHAGVSDPPPPPLPPAPNASHVTVTLRSNATSATGTGETSSDEAQNFISMAGNLSIAHPVAVVTTQIIAPHEDRELFEFVFVDLNLGTFAFSLLPRTVPLQLEASNFQWSDGLERTISDASAPSFQFLVLAGGSADLAGPVYPINAAYANGLLTFDPITIDSLVGAPANVVGFDISGLYLERDLAVQLVPEPSTGVLSTILIAGSLVTRRRRRRRGTTI